MEKKRNASLDLLKCICMILIIAHHYVVHGGYDGINIENFSKGRFFLQQVGMYGSLSCDVFALISGYYLIGEKGDTRKRFGKFIRLLLEMLFYSVIIYIIMLSTHLIEFSPMGAIKAIFPNVWGNWYIIAYLLFYAFVPLINPILSSLSKEKYKWYLVVMLICWSVVPTITYLDSSWTWSNVDFFVVMYSIGAYFRLHVIPEQKTDTNRIKKISLFCGVLSIVFLAGAVCVIDYIGLKFGRSDILSMGSVFMPLFSVPAVFCAISWFAYFCSIEFSSRFISYISSTVFGIYLIHENDYVRVWIWQMFSPNVNYVNSPYIHFLFKIVAIFSVCFVIESIRKMTVARIDNLVENVVWKGIGEKLKEYFRLD